MTAGPISSDELLAAVGAQVDGSLASLLDRIEAFIRRFVVFSNDHQPAAVVLWLAHCYAIEAAVRTGYLRIHSAVEESGKTTLLEVLSLILGEARSINTVSITPAYLFRMRDKEGPVALLLDEVDQTLRDRKDDGARDVLALVNAGYRRGATVGRTVGRDHEARRFKVFGPCAIAGMATLAPATESRCIPITLDRKRRGEGERFLSFLVEDEARTLGEALAAWASPDVVGDLREASPSYPEGLRDRQVEAWWALLAIADLAGAAWPKRARAAAVAIHGGIDEESIMSTGVLLLSHIRQAFAEVGVDRLTSGDLIRRLVANEQGPWASWWGSEVERIDRDETPQAAASELARKLRPFGVRPAQHRFADRSVKGYLHEDFIDSWSRYLSPSLPETGETPETPLASHVSDVSGVSGGSQENRIESESADHASDGILSLLAAHGPLSVPNLAALAGQPWATVGAELESLLTGGRVVKSYERGVALWMVAQ